MIHEQEINDCLEELSGEALTFEEHLQGWAEWQPLIAHFVLSDDFQLLTEEEKEILLFGATVIVSLARKNETQSDPLTEDEIGDLEEANWIWLEEADGNSLHDKLDEIFEDYPEQELLAFVEDLISDEEELSRLGSEVILVGLKTLIDALFLGKVQS